MINQVNLGVFNLGKIKETKRKIKKKKYKIINCFLWQLLKWKQWIISFLYAKTVRNVINQFFLWKMWLLFISAPFFKNKKVRDPLFYFFSPPLPLYQTGHFLFLTIFLSFLFLRHFSANKWSVRIYKTIFQSARP